MAVNQQHTFGWVYILLLWVLAFGLAQASPSPPPPPAYKIGNYTLLSTARSSATTYDFVYKARLTNNSASIAVATTATLLPPKSSKFTIIQGILNFGDVPAMTTVTSKDTFTIRRSKREALSKDDLKEYLKWQITTGSAPSNNPPVANAGINQTVPIGNNVILNGSASSDPDGNSLTYDWSFKQVPLGSTVVLSSVTAVNPSFTPDKSGIYVVQLVVNDGTINSDPSETQITVILTPKQKIQSLEDQGAIPNLERSPDVQGTDVNTNGIRDDVETYIATYYTSTPQRSAAEQFARVVQAAMLVDKTNAAAAKSIALRSSRAVNCIYSNFNGNLGTKKPAAVVKELKSLSTNTKARLLAYLAYSKALDGTSGSIPEGDTCE
jgi:hypothetical protein